MAYEMRISDWSSNVCSSDLEDRVFSTGEFHIPGQQRGYRDAHGGGGWVDLHKSIAASVNYYYYKLAYDMGIDKLAAYMYRYGFGEPTGIDLTGENAGIVPSREWKAKHRPEPWYPGDRVIAGIGQGYWDRSEEHTSDIPLLTRTPYSVL